MGTDIEVPAQGSCSAEGDVAQSLDLLGSQRMEALEHRAIFPDDVPNIKTEARTSSPVMLAVMHDGLFHRLLDLGQRLQGATDVLSPCLREMQVAGGAPETCMPQQNLDGTKVQAILEQMGGKCVAKQVRVDAYGECCLASGLLDDKVDRRAGQRAILALTRKQQGAMRTVVSEVLPELCKKGGRKKGVTVSASLAATDMDDHVFAVDVRELEATEFAYPQTCPVEGQEDCFISEAASLCEETDHLLLGGDNGKSVGNLSADDLDLDVRAAHGNGEEEGESPSVDVVSRGAELLDGEPKQEDTNHLWGDSCWADGSPFKEPSDTADVGVDGVLGHPSKLEVFHHLVAKLIHGNLQKAGVRTAFWRVRRERVVSVEVTFHDQLRNHPHLGGCSLHHDIKTVMRSAIAAAKRLCSRSGLARGRGIGPMNYS